MIKIYHDLHLNLDHENIFLNSFHPKRAINPLGANGLPGREGKNDDIKELEFKETEDQIDISFYFLKIVADRKAGSQKSIPQITGTTK